MALMTELFSTPYGLMSLAAIAITIGMGIFFLRFFLTRIAQDPGPGEAPDRPR
jgi:hypothetical protein